MYSIGDKKRSSLKEFMVILVKAVAYLILLYLYFNPPLIFQKYPKLAHANTLLLFFTLSTLSISIIRFIVVYFYIKKNRLKSDVKDNFILGINRIVSVINTLFIITTLMYFVGIDPKTFLTSITIVAAAIALIFKDYLTNMINGLIIMFSDRLSLGDHIKVQNEEGKILDITLLNIVLQNEDNDTVLIPNSVIITSIIVNQSKQNIKKLTLDFEIDVKLGLTPADLEKILYPLIAPYQEIMQENGFTVKTMEMKKDAALFKLQIILKRHDKLKERELRRIIYSKVLSLPAKNRED